MLLFRGFRLAYIAFTPISILAFSFVVFNLPANAAYAAPPVCSSSSYDDNDDGYGWENSQSCVVSGSNAEALEAAEARNTYTAGTITNSGVTVCEYVASDDNNDGWGWENNRSCVVDDSSAVTNLASTGGTPVCAFTASDPDGDGWGYESSNTCVVTSASSNDASGSSDGAALPPVSAATAGYSNGHPICLTDASDDGNNGFGYENNRTCVVVTGATATRSQPLLNQRSCIPWLEIGYGNYRLQNNTWNSDSTYSNNWSQCIELTGGPSNYVAKWDYNWLQRSEGDEFAVKSYPQVYYGRKSRYNLSGSVAETGLPVLTDSMPQFWVEYDYSETGIVERNVALESFFHTSCDVEEYNKQYEMMVWVGVPTIRTPGKPVTTVTLSGKEWEVYINPTLGWAYVAFVAKQPHSQGTLNWNEFVYWSKNTGPSFGVPAMWSNTCMGAIEIGTETFWGTGTFTLNKFKVN